ncbi:hypothetical protein [Phocaeicola sartorii]|uniref:hypothetical protein n=1 Tax=Phocaeicola sartorii TaxID=671267 RepID=UPI003512AA34
MKKETKENIQYGSALGMLVLAAGLAIAGFLVVPTGEIHDSVLWMFAQCLLYAGSVFGISVYISGRFKYLENKFLNKKEEDNENPA